MEKSLDGIQEVTQSSTATTIRSISGAVTKSYTLTQDVMANQAVVIGGGTYDGTMTPNAIVFTAEAELEVQGVTGDDPALEIENGAMALLNGGLEVAKNAGGGVVGDSHLYIHGGDVSISVNEAALSGAGLYAMDFGSDVTLTSPAYVTLLSAGAAPAKVTMPDGMIVFTEAVPEPATATLSLLALAALCTRRRRK